MRTPLALASLCLATPMAAATFTVTTAADSGAGSLRQAILDSTSSAGQDTIQFAIPGSGVHTISLLTPLPALTQPTTIDGYTQPGSSPNTLPFPQGLNTVLTIEINGQSLPVTLDAMGIRIESGGVVIRGLAINRCLVGGIRTPTGGAYDGIQIKGNFIGTRPDGLSVPRGVGVARQNFGVFLQGGLGLQIGGSDPADRNLISGNNNEEANAEGTGVVVGETVGSIPSAVILGNVIGTDKTVTVSLPNGSGIATQTGTEPIQIGGSGPGEGNIVSGNANLGMGVQTRGALITIRGNIVGTDASTTRNLGNRGGGIVVSTPAVAETALIGGIGPGEANVVAFNGGRPQSTFAGVSILSFSTIH